MMSGSKSGGRLPGAMPGSRMVATHDGPPAIWMRQEIELPDGGSGCGVHVVSVAVKLAR